MIYVTYIPVYCSIAHLSISEMALSKRFSSIAAAAAPENHDDDEAYDDEILQRLLKNKTNFTTLAPSKFDFQLRDDLGAAGVSDEEDELDEGWQNDFKSLLKSSGNNKAVSGDGDKAVENIEEDSAQDTAKVENVSEVGAASHNSKINFVELSSESNSNSHRKKIDVADSKAQSRSSAINKKAKEEDIKIRGGKETADILVRDSRNVRSSFLADAPDSAVPLYECKHEVHTDSHATVKDLDHRHKEELDSPKTIKLTPKKPRIQTDVDHKAHSGRNKAKYRSSLKCEPPLVERTSDVDFDIPNESEKSSQISVTSNAITSKEKAKREHSQAREQERISKTVAEKQRPSKTQTNSTKANAGSKESFSNSRHDKTSKPSSTNRELKHKKSFTSESKPNNSSSTTCKKEIKQVKPLVIKQATSFPLDELLPATITCKKSRASLDSSIDMNNNHESPSNARKRHKSDMLSNYQQVNAKKLKVDFVQRLKSEEVQFEENQSMSSNYIPEDVASLLAAVDTNQSLLSFFKQKLYTETGGFMPSDSDKKLKSVDSKSFGYYKERKEECPFMLSKDQDSNNSEELFHLLVQQCSELVKTEEDQSKLQSLVDLLKTEGGGEFNGTGFTPELETDQKSPPSVTVQKSPPSPYSPKSKQNPALIFEGRTLLKGGVEPRHIPKNFISKLGKSRPTDPRTFSNCKTSHVLPLPKFAEEFWKKEKVKQLRKQQWTIKDETIEKNKKVSKVRNTHTVKDNTHGTYLANEQPNDSTTTSFENQFATDIGVLGENNRREIDTDVASGLENLETVRGLSTFHGVKELGFYAAVAEVFGYQDEIAEHTQASVGGVERETQKNNDVNSIPVVINGVETIPVSTGTIMPSGQQSQNKTYEPSLCSRPALIEMNKNVSSVNKDAASVKSSTQMGPFVGIVKPMPANVSKDKSVAGSRSGDVDTRYVSMDLSSDCEEGEINPKTEDILEIEKLNKNKRAATLLNDNRGREKVRNKSHAAKCVKRHDRIIDDGSSSCSSASSRSRGDKRYWRRSSFDYRSENYRGRQRYSSSSSVDSRSSGRSFSEKKKVRLSSESSRSHHSRQSDDRYYRKGDDGRHDSKSRTSYSYRQQEKQKPLDKRQTHRHYNGPKENSRHFKNSENSKSVHMGDKRHVKQNKSEIQQSKSIQTTKSSLGTNVKSKPRYSEDDTDSEDQQYSLDYKEKFGRVKADVSLEDSESQSRSSVTSLSKPLPDLYKADREFLSYMQKKFDMADKVKHEGASDKMLGSQKDRNENDNQSTKNKDVCGTTAGRRDKPTKRAVLGSLGSNSCPPGKRRESEPQDTSCFMYSDMYALADLEET